MSRFRYHRVDVFTDRAFCGNPLAVFLDAEALTGDQMQVIAREMNLSETVFCLPPTDPQAAVRLRIFTVDREIPLAGHPVVGTWHVLASTGAVAVREGTNALLGQLSLGVLPVEIEVREGVVETVVMTQNPPLVSEPFADLELVARSLGLNVAQVTLGDLLPRVVNTGVPWFLMPLVDLAALKAVAPDFGACRELAAAVGTDLFHAFTQETGDPACHVRTRHVWFGTVTPGEDPVTGSAAGCIGAFLVHEGIVAAFPTAEIAIEQGEEVQRPGRVTVLVKGQPGDVTKVQVGGRAVHVGSGELFFDEA